MPKFRITCWTDYATTHEVEAANEKKALEYYEEHEAETVVGTYYGDTIKVEIEEA